MKCLNCKKDIPDNSQFCGFCGAILKVENEGIDIPSKGYNRKYLYILVAIIFSVILITVLWIIPNFSEDKEAEIIAKKESVTKAHIKQRLSDYYSVLENEDYEKMRGFFVNPVLVYYGNTNHPVSEIIEGAKRYYSRWKYRKVDIDWESLHHTILKNNDIEVNYYVDYWVKREQNQDFKYFYLSMRVVFDKDLNIKEVSEEILKTRN